MSFHVASGSSVDGQHLFLGADVVTGVNQPAKNFPRIHARYMRSGVATKVEFPDLNLDGIKNSSALWFYSIQGLFQVVFEYRDLEVQRDCLLQLQDAWMKRYLDPALPESLRLTWHQHLHSMPPHSSTSVDQFEDLEMECEDLMRSEQMSTGSQHLQPPQALSASASSELIVGNLSVGPEELYRTEQRVPSLGVGLHCGELGPGAASLPVRARDVLEGALQSVQALQNRDGLSAAEEAELAVLKLVLDFIHLDLQHQVFENDNCFPLGLLESYMSIVRNCNTEAMDNDFHIPARRDVALKVICQWLGQELHQLEPEISHRMESFKKVHITSIDELPKAEDVVRELFPQCMTILVSHWCGFEGLNPAEKFGVLDQGSCGVEQALPDHSYSTQVGVAKVNLRGGPPVRQAGGQTPMNAYPIIQLILEFACNNLLSGAAHVVYALLRVEK